MTKKATKTGKELEWRVADAEGIYRSEVLPGLWLRVEWLWQESLPKVLDVLREMELI